jgi:DNA-binding GntR family transcriptional regulator
MPGKKNGSTLDQEAYEKIKQMIFRRDLGHGQRLIYDDLCKLLEMSRTPIVAAMSRLENEGFLVSTPFKGCSVKPMDMEELKELYGVREALESYAVERTIVHVERKSNLVDTFCSGVGVGFGSGML